MKNIVKGLGLIFSGCLLLAVIVIACAVTTADNARNFLPPPCMLAALVAVINIISGYWCFRRGEE